MDLNVCPGAPDLQGGSRCAFRPEVPLPGLQSVPAPRKIALFSQKYALFAGRSPSHSLGRMVVSLLCPQAQNCLLHWPGFFKVKRNGRHAPSPSPAFSNCRCFWKGSAIGSSQEGTAGRIHTLHGGTKQRLPKSYFFSSQQEVGDMEARSWQRCLGLGDGWASFR